MNERTNERIFIAPIETSEALAAEEMTFESFCECLRRQRQSLQFDGEAVPYCWARHRDGKFHEIFFA